MPRVQRIGFIGNGGMAVAHTTAMAGFKNVKFAAFCDLKKDKAAAMAAKFGGEAFKDPVKMFAASDLDAVWIAIPPCAHGDAEFAALEAGVPFFVEKPINKDVKQAAKIASAVGKAGLLTCVGYMNRYQKSVQAARAALQADPGIYAYGGWIGAPPWNPVPGTIMSWWVQKDQSGGQFIEQVTHSIDLARYLLGDAETVSAFAARGFVKGIKKYSIDDALAVSVQFKSGAVANFCASCSSSARGGVFFDVYSLDTAVKLTGWGHSAEIFVTGKKTPKTIAWRPDIFAVEDAAFLKAVRTGNTAGIMTNYADALKTCELTVAATESAESGGKAITLKY
jgi:myo-inositol 2-dehydrogenase / D-chiro-inositol 1-dehydrogenase